MDMIIARQIATRVPIENATLQMRNFVTLASIGTFVRVSSNPVITFTKKPSAMNFSIISIKIILFSLLI